MPDLKMATDVGVEITTTNSFRSIHKNAMSLAMAIQVNTVVALGV